MKMKVLGSSDEIVKKQNTEKLKELEKKFYQACNQLEVMDRKLQELFHRFNSKDNLNSAVKYNKKLQIMTLEGVRDVYWEYSKRTHRKMTELWHEIHDT